MIAASLLAAAFGLSAAMLVAWQVQRKTGQSGWVDTIWSLSTGVITICLIGFLWPGTLVSFVVLGLIVVWSGRLAGHIFKRTHGAGDDPRYAALKLEWGAAADHKMLIFLQYQAFAGWVLVACCVVAAMNAHCSPWQAVAGGGLGLTALLGEAIADTQLSHAKRARERLCKRGLWQFSRHPNYFCEWLFWLAVAVLAQDFSLQTIGGLLAFAGPIMMYWLLVHVSGVPLLERHMAATRGQAWQDYALRTPVFFPRWKPKS